VTYVLKFYVEVRVIMRRGSNTKRRCFSGAKGSPLGLFTVGMNFEDDQAKRFRCNAEERSRELCAPRWQVFRLEAFSKHLAKVRPYMAIDF
jgi:hypothetical protein